MSNITIYLRVITDAQDVANQKLGCLEYLAKNGWSNPLIIEDTVNGVRLHSTHLTPRRAP
jgi:hypothetical protein